MIISVINHTNGKITDEELHRVIRAINRQIAEDFEPYWSISGRLRLEGRSTKKPDQVKVADMRGDAIIYLWDEVDVDDAIGYHDKNNRGIPFGFVFTEIAAELNEPWSVTLSHEALELLGDPETNMLVMGPHPSEDRDVFHWFEMCDAVQTETYKIDDVDVSNFVLPLYFTGTRETDEVGARNDFLGRLIGGKTLTSFGINPGGYVGFFDPETGDHETFSNDGDQIAMNRLQVKSKAKQARRSIRYRNFDKLVRAQAKRGVKPAKAAKSSVKTPAQAQQATFTSMKVQAAAKASPIKEVARIKAQSKKRTPK